VFLARTGGGEAFWTDNRMTEPQTDTSTDSKGRYSSQTNLQCLDAIRLIKNKNDFVALCAIF